jgi:hypothetical protein
MAEAQQTVAETTDKQVPLDFDADAPDVEVSLEGPALAEEVSDAEVIEVR